MSEINDNQEMTINMLNNIAVDLGDTTFSAFSANKFGVDKLNEITADIVSKGILKTAKDSNNNPVMGCEPVVSGDNILIQNGVIVFNSGAKIRITSPVSIAKTSSTYIYAVNNLLTGRASIEVLTAELTSGDYVPIATVNSDGNVTDTRLMATTKIPVSASAENTSVTGNITATLKLNQTKTIDMGFAGFKFFLYTTNASYPEWEAVDLSDGEEHDIRFKNLYTADCDGRVKKEGSNLIFRGTYSSGLPYDLNFEVR